MSVTLPAVTDDKTGVSFVPLSAITTETLAELSAERTVKVSLTDWFALKLLIAVLGV